MRPLGPLVIGVFLLFQPMSAQTVPERRLTTPDAKLAHQFSAINGIRELPDGRVLVSDGIDEVVLRADLRTGRADTIGRVGQGPGEYKKPDALFALANNGTLLVDLGNGRLDMLDGTGRFIESVPIAQGSMPSMVLILPRATDAQGRVYFQPAIGGPRGELPDSASIVRWDRARSRFDTVGRVKLPAMHTETSGGASNQSVRQGPRPFAPQDAWNAGPDGRIAIVRAGEYRVDWVDADGRMVRGRPVPATPVPIREADKREWAAEQANGLRVSVANRNGQVSMSFYRGQRAGDEEEAAIRQADWPATKPVFSNVWVTPSGTAWVERSVPAGQPRRVDVFEATGALKERIVLPAGRRIVGFGNGVVYLRYADADGLEFLERYRI